MKWLWQNFWLKIIAFGMGLLVWIHVATEKTYNYDIRLPIAEIQLNDGLALSRVPPDSLRVSVTATGKQLLRRTWRELGVRINASQFEVGRHALNLTTGNTFLVYTSQFMSLDEIISPTTIQLEVDDEASTQVPVKADFEITADEGFAVGQNLIIVPEQVTLTGPESRLDRISEVMTEPRRLTGIRNPVTIDVALVTPSGFGYRLRPDSARVTVPVVPVKTRVYEGVPVVVFNAPPLVRVATEPSSLRVEITGPPEDIDLLNRNALTLSVDYRHINASSRAAVKVDLPPGFGLKRLSEDSVLIMLGADADSGR
jgi:YbbR domain-containing protein